MFTYNSNVSFKLVIETVVAANKRGWTGIDDFVFESGNNCALKPSKAAPAQLGHDCTFDNGLCGQWYEIQIPGGSYWTVTSANELESINVEGPVVDHNDSKDGM